MPTIFATAWVGGWKTLVPLLGLLAIEDGPSEFLRHDFAHDPSMITIKNGENTRIVVASDRRNLAASFGVGVRLPVEQAVVLFLLIRGHRNLLELFLESFLVTMILVTVVLGILVQLGAQRKGWQSWTWSHSRCVLCGFSGSECAWVDWQAFRGDPQRIGIVLHGIWCVRNIG
jgi:hypothetical protein